MACSPQRSAADSTATGPWWRGAVIYQIYPRSFQDSNGDGIGDLPGITARLPYVASLGVDVIWISPFYPSPMEDFGYDIADHCQVDPMFGTLADFDELLGVAHGLGLRVIIDLVLSHTSDRHPWFVASRWRLPRIAQKLVASLLLSVRGSVCLYQGEELGLPQAELELSDMRDPYGIHFWPEYPGRDGCRTPMVWTPEPPHGGFSDGQPGLPVPPDHLPLAVAAQAGDPQSVLNHYRSMLAFRRSHPALVAGRLAELSAERDVVSFTRAAGAETLHCAFNLSSETVRVALPHGAWQALEVPGFATTVTERDLVLPPWQAHLARRA